MIRLEVMMPLAAMALANDTAWMSPYAKIVIWHGVPARAGRNERVTGRLDELALAPAGANNLRIRGVLPMMQPQEQVDGTDAVIRTHQLEFLVFGQIAQMDGAEFSERDVNAD
jgi:hypothetical protein